MTDSVLTKKQEDLLVRLVNNKKYKVKLSDALEVYDTKKHAKSALKTLNFHGFLEKDPKAAAGVYLLVSFPATIKDRINEEILQNL